MLTVQALTPPSWEKSGTVLNCSLNERKYFTFLWKTDEFIAFLRLKLDKSEYFTKGNVYCNSSRLSKYILFKEIGKTK